jgi:hypothetical protein
MTTPISYTTTRDTTPEHGRECRPAQGNRLYLEGMMWIARTGAQ